MNAADQIAHAEKWEAAHRKLATVVGWLIVAAALLGAGWCSGRSHEITVTTAAHADSVRKVAELAIARDEIAERDDSLAVARATARLAIAHDSTIAAAYRDSLARARSSAGHVRQLNDSTVAIHDTVLTVPPVAVRQLMDDAATIKADTALIAKQQGELTEAYGKIDSLTLQLTSTKDDRTQHKIVANVDAAQLKVSQPKHRLGFKAGLVAGAGIVLAILHFAH